MQNFEKGKSFETDSPKTNPLSPERKIDSLTDKGELDTKELLKKQETRFFSYDNGNANKNAEHVLVSINDTGAYNNVAGLIQSLEHDPRCGKISALVPGPAEKNFEIQFHDDIKEVPAKSDYLLKDVLEFSEKKPFDIAIGTVSAFNGPESVILYGGKSNFNAKKIFLIADGWGTLGSQFSSDNLYRMDEVNAILCVDNLSKKIFQRLYPQLPEELFKVVGSTVVDGLRLENPEEFIISARAKLNLSDDTIAILYFGDTSTDYKTNEYDSNINEKTFIETFDSLIKLAKNNPGQDYALLFRPHPRDPNKHVHFDYVDNADIPPNLHYISASGDNISMQELRYASDVVMSIISTENFFAPYLGRQAIFLGYQQEGFGGKVLDNVYGQDIKQEISSPGLDVHIASSGEHLVEILKNSHRAPQNIKDFPDLYCSGNSAEIIKRIIFSK